MSDDRILGATAADNDWFLYVPEANGRGGTDNKDAEPERRIDIEIRRATSLELLAQRAATADPGKIYRWRDDVLGPQMVDAATGQEKPEAELIRQLDVETLVGLRQFKEQTRKPRNILVDGEVIGDPVDMFLLLAGDLTGGRRLINEIQSAILIASTLRGDELKNFKGRSDSLNGSTSPNATSVEADSERPTDAP